MQHTLDKIKMNLQEELLKDDIIVDDILYEKKGKYYFLTVVLDKVGGIDLETIVEATKTVNKIVDQYDKEFDSYILDVVSKERG